MVEYYLAKVNVEGSNPFFRLNFMWTQRQFLTFPFISTGNDVLVLTHCGYILMVKFFVFQIKDVGSIPTNRIK